MTAALSPELAIAYVRELSADVRAAVVLAADGAVLAGEPDLARPALDAGHVLGPGAVASARTAAGLVVAARTADHTLLVVSGPLALESTAVLDADAAVAALSGARENTRVEPKPAFRAAVAAAIGAIFGA